MSEELIKEDKPQVIKLGEGEYTLSPLTLNVMVGLEEEFDCSLSLCVCCFLHCCIV